MKKDVGDVEEEGRWQIEDGRPKGRYAEGSVKVGTFHTAFCRLSSGLLLLIIGIERTAGDVYRS